MKTITLDQFETLLESDKWERDIQIEFLNQGAKPVDLWNHNDKDFDPAYIPHTIGEATKTSTLGDIKITYTESFAYDDFDRESLSTTTECQDKIWTLEGVSVVDDEGDKLSAWELAYHHRLIPVDFREIEYDFDFDDTVDIDIGEDSKMETIILEVDNEPNIRFCGECIAAVESSDNQAAGRFYSGRGGRWTRLKLFKTSSGKYVCHQVGVTCIKGERNRHSADVCESIEQVKDFFGHRWLAKELYDEAAIEDVTVVE